MDHLLKLKKDDIHEFLTDPLYSKSAFFYHMFQYILILISTITFLIATEPEQWQTDNEAIHVIEVFSITCFTFDYLARLLSAKMVFFWFFGIFNLIDLFAILPFYLELAMSAGDIGGLAILRVVRLLRILRVLKVSRYNSEAPILIKTVQKSKAGFFLLGFGLTIPVLILSACLFYGEQSSGGQTFDKNLKVWYRQDGSESPFQSILDCMWWAVVTATTIGYGDTFPVTTLGKLIAAATMIVGSLVIAFPLVIFGTNFQSASEEVQEETQTNYQNKMVSELNKLNDEETKSQFSEKDKELLRHQCFLLIREKCEDCIEKSSWCSSILNEQKERIYRMTEFSNWLISSICVTPENETIKILKKKSSTL